MNKNMLNEESLCLRYLIKLFLAQKRKVAGLDKGFRVL